MRQAELGLALGAALCAARGDVPKFLFPEKDLFTYGPNERIVAITTSQNLIGNTHKIASSQPSSNPFTTLTAGASWLRLWNLRADFIHTGINSCYHFMNHDTSDLCAIYNSSSRDRIVAFQRISTHRRCIICVSIVCPSSPLYVRGSCHVVTFSSRRRSARRPFDR